MPQRQYSQKQTDVTKKNKRLTLPIPLAAYNELKENAGAFRQWLDEMIEKYPELFPSHIEKGYTLHDVLPASSKLPQVQLRRIRVKEASASGQAQVYTITSRPVGGARSEDRGITTSTAITKRNSARRVTQPLP